MPQPHAWKIDKRVSLMFLLALFGHMFGLIVWATYLEARVSGLEIRAQNIPAISESLARMEERIDAIHTDIAQVRRQLEKLGDAASRGR